MPFLWFGVELVVEPDHVGGLACLGPPKHHDSIANERHWRRSEFGRLGHEDALLDSPEFTSQRVVSLIPERPMMTVNKW